MQFVYKLLRRHWGKAVVALALSVAAIVLVVSPWLRLQALVGWQATINWVGLGSTVESNQVFWCPMHPQIKSAKENAVCPICNMALVQLEGGIVEAPEHLTLTAQQIQQAGVVTRPVLPRKLYREIDTTGRIDYDERQLAKITSWVQGKARLEKLHVSFIGQSVTKGEPLAELYSPELITAQQEFLLALETLSSRGDKALSRELLSAARQKLKYQGLQDKQIDELSQNREVLDRITIYSPLSGTITKRHVQEGQYVVEGEVLFEVADLSTLWLMADVFEDELSMVAAGSPVQLSVSNRPGETFAGEVAFIDPVVRPATRTVPVRIDVDNRHGKLLPGMFARVGMQHEFPSVLAVPENAVLWSGKRSVVILKTGDGTFRPVEIETGKRWMHESPSQQSTPGEFSHGRDRYHEVLAGLAAGDEVVTSGAFLLNAESQFQSVLSKMLPPQSQRVTLEEVLGDDLAAKTRQLLDGYFQLSGALADDKIDQVPSLLKALTAAATALSHSANQNGAAQLAEDAKRFEQLLKEHADDPIENPRDARSRFARISHALTRLLRDHGGKTLFGSEMYQFECGMGQFGYERWLWWSPEIHSSYMGQKMLNCGRKLEALEP